MTEGNVNVYTGWKEDDEFVYATEIADYAYGEVSKTIDLSSTLPSYLKFDVTEDAVITSVTINYACEPSDTNSSFTLIADAPVINGGEESLPNYNHVWVNTNISTGGNAWETFLMTERGDGKWTYTFHDVAVDESWAKGYKFSLYLGSESSADWSCGATSKNIGVRSFEGQTEFYATGDAVAFSSQPAKVAYETYKLNVAINITGDIPETFDNIQVVYYNPDTETNVWNELRSTEHKNTFIFETPSEMSTNKNLTFEVYIYDAGVGGSGNIHINPAGDGTWFNLTPTKQYAVEYVTVEFDYPTSDGNKAGTFTHQNASGMVVPSQEVAVIKDQVELVPEFTAASEAFDCTYSGTDIRVDEDNVLTGIKGGTTTKVTLNSKTSSKTSFFFAAVTDNRYVENYDGFVPANSETKSAVTEQWWDEHPQADIIGLDTSFWNGVDVSSAYALYQNGAHFYNKDGVEESLFRQLKNAGVNYTRIRLWVKPETSSGVSYGGGHNDLATAKWLAKEAKAEGLKVLLDFHYSDFWADPFHQALPKDWAHLTGSSLLSKITSYTTTALNEFADEGLTPDMVQLGNEISSGVLVQKLSGEDTIDDGVPTYHNSLETVNPGITISQFVHAASEGVKAVSSSIKRVVHWTKGGSGSTYSAVNSFFGGLNSSDYDYAGLSVYPYNCFDSMSEAQTLFNGIDIPGKQWFVAETSYPFSGSSWAGDLTEFTYTNSKKGEKGLADVSGYGFDAAGQAKVIHDMTAAIVGAGGLGAFYWEPAWIPNANVGWASEGSKCSWSNQGFFSYDGKAMPNLGLVQSMIPNA